MPPDVVLPVEPLKGANNQHSARGGRVTGTNERCFGVQGEVGCHPTQFPDDRTVIFRDLHDLTEVPGNAGSNAKLVRTFWFSEPAVGNRDREETK